MIFPYDASLTRAPDGTIVTTYRPMIPIRIVGPDAAALYLALVDTGADGTVLPRSVADDLGIVPDDQKADDVTAFGGTRLRTAPAKAQFELSDGTDSCRWETTVDFVEFPDPQHETLILGHEGFLQFFTATFNGKMKTVELLPNDALPSS